MSSQTQPLAAVSNWDDFGDGYELVLACGGDQGDDHMVPMVMNWDAATPHGECPECGNIAFCTIRKTGDSDGE